MANSTMIVGYEALNHHYCNDHFDRSKFSRSVQVSPIFSKEAESHMHCTVCGKSLSNIGETNGQTENL